MGVFSSKPYNTDPSAFATEVSDSATEDVSRPEDYKTYDYIIIGAGGWSLVENPRPEVLN